MKYRKFLIILIVFGFFLSIINSFSNIRYQVCAIDLSIIYVVFLVTEYFLFNRNQIPGVSEFELDLDVLRELAVSEKGALPVRLNSLVVAEGEIPDWIVVAGGALHNFTISFTSFQVVYEDSTVIIEAPFDKILFDKFCKFKVLGIKGRFYDEEKFYEMQKAMSRARYIVATHEHWDHVGGISQSPYFDVIWDKVVLTEEQVKGHTIKDAGFKEGVLEECKPLNYDGYHVLSPGIVLIKAPGHSLGSQMIFIQLENGEEFLFIGDVVWNLINIEQLRNHSMIGMLLRYENGMQLGHQIRWLHENIYLKSEEKIHLVTSHDRNQIKNYQHISLIGDKFE